nr:DegV family protein [uncultured Blautia sp.]
MKHKRKNIVLIGFMGSGKTTLGLKLSYLLRMPVEDTDKLIERQEGRSITQIFADDGEAYFRELETELLRKCGEQKYERILSVGGGTPVNPVNRPLLHRCGTVVYLRVSPEVVYERLKNDETISTSQPSPAEVCGLWDNLLKEYDEVVHIPMSSGLSASCDTATMLSRDYDGKVEVVNNQRISVTQRQSVLDALVLRDAGKSAAEIRAKLEEEKMESSIYITLETLKYLKKGGRITPAAAAIGTVLNLKPVLQIQGEKLDAYAKVRGKKQAKRIMMKAMQEDWNTRFKQYVESGEMCLQIAYAGNKEEAEEFKKEVEAAFPGMDIHMDPLSLSVACHIGHGALAVACSKKVTV